MGLKGCCSGGFRVLGTLRKPSGVLGRTGGTSLRVAFLGDHIQAHNQGTCDNSAQP